MGNRKSQNFEWLGMSIWERNSSGLSVPARNYSLKPVASSALSVFTHTCIDYSVAYPGGLWGAPDPRGHLRGVKKERERSREKKKVKKGKKKKGKKGQKGKDL